MKTTTKDNYGGITGPRTGPQKQDHGFQDLNLPLGTQKETQDSSNPRTATRAAATGRIGHKFDSDYDIEFQKRMGEMEEGWIRAAQLKKLIDFGKRERERGKSEGEGLNKKEEGDQKTKEEREVPEDLSRPRTKPTGLRANGQGRGSAERERGKNEGEGLNKMEEGQEKKTKGTEEGR